MNREGLAMGFPARCVPRASGDEPDREFSEAWEAECSPREWG